MTYESCDSRMKGERQSGWVQGQADHVPPEDVPHERQRDQISVQNLVYREKRHVVVVDEE